MMPAQMRATASLIRREIAGREEQFPACLRYAQELEREADLATQSQRGLDDSPRRPVMMGASTNPP